MKSPLSLIRSRHLSKSKPLPPFLTLLDFDCRVLIYKTLLASEYHFYFNNPTPGLLDGLLRSCKFLRDEIKQWYRLNRKQNWLTTIPSLGLGIFAPDATIFHLDFDYRTRGNLNLLQRHRRRAVQKAHIHEFRPAVEVELYKIEHLVIHRDTLPKYPKLSVEKSEVNKVLSAMKNLKSVEFAIRVQESRRSLHSMSCELWELWTMFWADGPFCHPKNCCSCCSLPVIKWTAHSPTLSYSGEAPFWGYVPCHFCLWPRFSWGIYNARPRLDEHVEHFHPRGCLCRRRGIMQSRVLWWIFCGEYPHTL
jgi:hypothetical protein